MLSSSPEKRIDLRRLYTLIGYLEDGETRGSGGAVENSAMKALEEVQCSAVQYSVVQCSAVQYSVLNPGRVVVFVV